MCDFGTETLKRKGGSQITGGENSYIAERKSRRTVALVRGKRGMSSRTEKLEQERGDLSFLEHRDVADAVKVKVWR